MNQRTSLRLASELDGDECDSLPLRLLTLFTRIVFYPVYLVFVGFDKLSGQEKWYRQQAEYMERRPPYSDEQLCDEHGHSAFSPEVWSSVRHAVSEAIGVRPDAIHPDDRLSDLMRMQFPVPDFLDFIFRIEKQMNLSIQVTSSEIAERLKSDSTFLDFVAAISDIVGEGKRTGRI